MTGVATVVGLGEAMLRLSTPTGERLDGVDGLDVHVAGSELNVCVALAALGVPTGWVSALPDSALGRRVARDARAAGVDLSRVRWVPGARLGLFFAETGTGARPTEVLYDRSGSAFAGFAPERIDLDGAAYALVSGITPALGETAAATAARFADAAARAGAGLVVDVNHRVRIGSAASAAQALRPFLAAADLVVCSHDDAARVLNCGGAPEHAVRAVRERWASLSSTVVLTCGTDGAVALGPDGVPHAQAAVPTIEVDGFGAGDAFVAGLLWGVIGGHGLPYALRAAVALGALACTVRGDQARFVPAELTAAMAGLPAATDCLGPDRTAAAPVRPAAGVRR